MLLNGLKKWAPFRLDALGLVTLLGAAELDVTVGRLVANRFTECLPLLAAYIVAGNNITKPIPGFTLYNITDGILATDVTGWFARWLLCQEFTNHSTVVYISPESQRVSLWNEAGTYALGIITMVPILLFPVIIGDWWGLANAVSMLISILVRRVVVGQNRRALDRATSDAMEMSSEVVKTFWTLPTGIAVTIMAPRGVILNCLLTNPRPPNFRLYNTMRALGWLGFGCHVITLGMATLFNQILSVTLLIVSTVLVARHVGDDEHRIGASLNLTIRNIEGNDFRAAAYARLQLSEKEESSMLAWNLFPHMSNERWWKKYRNCQAAGLDTFETWDKILAGHLDIDQKGLSAHTGPTKR